MGFHGAGRMAMRVVAVWIGLAVAVLMVAPRGPGWAEETKPAAAGAATAPAAGTAAAAATAPAEAPAPEPPPTEEEKKDAEIGKKAAEEIEKELKVIEGYSVAGLEEVVNRLRPVTEKPRQKYTLKVVDSKAINAFSLPGGYLYFTKGLMTAVESVDELAAVTGHEMAHVCLNHARRQMARDDRYTKMLGATVLAAILAQNSGVNPGELAVIGSLVKTDALNHYGREAELESDLAAVRYLQASKVYHPVAVLTVVEGLARIDEAEPGPDAGVFQTHPYAKERVVAVRKNLSALHIPIERGRVRKGLTATAGPAQVNGQETGELRLDDQLVFQPAATVDGLSPVARAQQAADLLNPLLLAEMDLVEISPFTRGDTVLLQARGETFAKITPADAAFHKTTVEALSNQAMKAIQAAFFADNTKRAY